MPIMTISRLPFSFPRFEEAAADSELGSSASREAEKWPPLARLYGRWASRSSRQVYMPPTRIPATIRHAAAPIRFRTAANMSAPRESAGRQTAIHARSPRRHGAPAQPCLRHYAYRLATSRFWPVRGRHYTHEYQKMPLARARFYARRCHARGTGRGEGGLKNTQKVINGI